MTKKTRFFFVLERAPAGAPRAPGAQVSLYQVTPRTGKKCKSTKTVFNPGATKAPWGPWGPSGAPGALGALGAPGALTPWPIPHKKKVELLKGFSKPSEGFLEAFF